MLREIYFEAYRTTAYRIQEEPETRRSRRLFQEQAEIDPENNIHNMAVDEIFPYVHNRERFVQQIMIFLEDCVTLPSQVATAQELVKEVFVLLASSSSSSRIFIFAEQFVFLRAFPVLLSACNAGNVKLIRLICVPPARWLPFAARHVKE